MSEDDRRREFDKAEREARLLLDASAALAGNADEVPTSQRDSLIVLLRINGNRQAVQCGHLTGPEVVHLHSATKVHMCGECASSPATLASIEANTQTECDSCGESDLRLDIAEFTASNILVTAYICDGCRFGTRRAVMPNWLRKP